MVNLVIDSNIGVNMYKKNFFSIRILFNPLLIIIAINNSLILTENRLYAQNDFSVATCFIEELEKCVPNHPIKEWRDYYYLNVAKFWVRAGNIHHVFEMAEKAPQMEYKYSYYLAIIEHYIFLNNIEEACNVLDSIKDVSTRDSCVLIIQKRYTILKEYSRAINLSLTISNPELRYQSLKDILLIQFRENKQDAVKNAQNLIELCIKVKILGVLALLYEDEGNRMEAQKVLQEAYLTVKQINNSLEKLLCLIFLSGITVRFESTTEYPFIWKNLRNEIEQFVTKCSQDKIILKQKLLYELACSQFTAKYDLLANQTCREVFSLILTVSDLSKRNELLLLLALTVAGHGNEKDTYNFLCHVTDKSVAMRYYDLCIEKMKNNAFYIEVIKFIMKLEASTSSGIVAKLTNLKLDLYQEMGMNGKHEDALKFANTISDIVLRSQAITYIAVGLYKANKKEKANSLWQDCFVMASAIARQDQMEYRKNLIINNVLYSQICAENIDDLSKWIKENVKVNEKRQFQLIIITLATVQAQKGFEEDALETLKYVMVPSPYTEEIILCYDSIIANLIKKKRNKEIQLLIPQMIAHGISNPKYLVYQHAVQAWSELHEFERATDELKKISTDSIYYIKALSSMILEKSKNKIYNNSLEMIRSIKSKEMQLELLHKICEQLFPMYDILPLLIVH
jgi:hypothetical protein